MDYLDRLDSALNTIEKEADKLAGITKLTRTLGEVADELSAEKREFKDITHELKHWSSDVSRDIKILDENVADAKKDLKALRENISAEKVELEDSINKGFNQCTKDLEITKKNIEELKEENQKLHNQIEQFQVQTEASNKTVKHLVIATTVLSLISCILSVLMLS